jgi:hypothetical protein
MFSSNNTCERYWDDADWLSPTYILEHWCQQDTRCWHAKQQALFSACERGEVKYRRSDGKTFDDPVDELARRGILTIERASFEGWVIRLDGHSPLPPCTVKPKPRPPYPSWADPGTYQFSESTGQWERGASTCMPPPIPTKPSWAEPSPDPLSPTVRENLSAESTHDEAPVQYSPASPDNTKVGSKDQDYANYPSEAELRERGVPADEIISAFRVRPDFSENEKWWRERMGNALRYKSITPALVQKGLANIGSKRYPSWWRPDIIAAWLIEERHLPGYKVIPQLKREFPDWAKHSDYLS